MFFKALITAAIGFLLAGCALLSPLPEKSDIEQRLAALPADNLPLKAPVVVHWDRHQIPFIEAKTDEDLAFALGLVHAHLRLGQMEMMRRISQGRIAEMAGPLATDIDHSLRILNFGRGSAATEKSLPPKTRAWIGAFVAGINHYQAKAKQLPAEYRLLRLKREPWTVRDVLTIGRLASTDVNWLVWFRALRLRDRPDWPQLWAKIVKTGGDSMASFKGPRRQGQLHDILRGMSRSGSNTLVVAGSRSATGAALIASDPHLGISLPNLWLIVGIKSPSYHAVGLMVPGLPFVALGRNERIAWGGTNMRAASSDLFDASKLKRGSVRTRTERIRVRWWFGRTIKIRETPIGPIITDAPLLESRGNGPLALRWVGHEPSDEIGAFLKVQRARNWREFRAAFKTFAVSAQNMLYADVDGNIGLAMAVRLPVRRASTPRDLVLDPTRASDRWHGYLSVLDLPASYNPSTGFLASANNRPAATKVPVGYFFSTDDRIARMNAFLKGNGKVGIETLKSVQRDVYMMSAVKLRDVIVRKLDELGVGKEADASEKTLIAALRSWDGRYTVDSRGAVAFELIHHYMAITIRKGAYAPEVGEALAAFAQNKALLAQDIERTEPAALTATLKAALAQASARFGDYKNWGEMHRLRLSHALGRLPLIGSRFRLGDVPAEGSTDTLWKTAHSTTDERHGTRYGSNARHISDLSDPDANYFVLLGGQDGWFNSSTYADQVPLWLKGKYVKVPLRLSTVRKTYPYKTRLSPNKAK